MTPELQLHYEKLLGLFESEGWREFMEDARIMAMPLEQVRGCDDLRFRQGQLDIADWITNYEVSNRDAYRQLAEE
jgi:hypothetical protein